ncbi:hypothetical protein ACH44C_34520 [Streptomyces purpureus]|uniref:hypothetical protein n=1 Tax=Streptomyces purpureus TaxID=1951 RepID=UPI00378A880B
MTDMQPYERLAALTKHFTTEVPLDEWLWHSLYEYAKGDVPAPEQITEVTDLWAISPEGYGSTEIAFLARLDGDRWASCVAWSDTSGFGCRQDVDWRINPTREAAIAMGLDKESRTHLGLSLPGEENDR